MNQSPPSVAVVILNFNGRKYLEQFLPYLLKSNYSNLQLIVGDNASTDDSIAFLNQHYPEIKLLLNDKNHGFAGGYNQILNRVQADYYILLNSDVEVTPNWITPVIELMESDTTIAACQPKIKSFQHKDHFEYAGSAGGFIDKYGYPFCRGRIFDCLEKDTGQYDDTKEVFWASGACMFVKSKIYHAAGGLDADFFAHMEEIDFCWRLKNKGYKIFYTSQSTVYHVGGGTLQSDSPFKTYLNFRNNLVLLQKNLPAWKATLMIKARLWLDLVALLKFAKENKWNHAKAISRSHIYFFGNQFSIIKKSSATKIDPIKKNLNGMYKRSIVWDFFAMKLNKFSKLNPAHFNDK